MTLKPRCDCSTCTCGNAPGRSGYCLNCEVTDSGAEGSHTQHTPGPWVTGDDDQGAILVLTDEQECVPLAEIFRGVDGSPEANAALISAAPGLLEALKSAADQLPCICGDNDSFCDCAVSEVNAAIAAAAGK